MQSIFNQPLPGGCEAAGDGGARPRKNGQHRNAIWSHIRHLRGHGIHSPFVYSIIREAFMERKILGDGRLYRELIEWGVRKKAARQLNNLYVHCSPSGHEITAVLKPYHGLPPQNQERLIIENRFFFLIFDSDQLPKQHFRI